MSDKVLITFHLSPDERDIFKRLAGRNQSDYLRRLIAEDAKKHGEQWPEQLQDTRGKYSREDQHNKTIWRSLKNRTAKYGLETTITIDDMLFCRDYWMDCAVCGSKSKHLVFDHWIPLGHPNCPGSTPDNMVILCASCNKEKNHIMPDAWLESHHPDKKDRVLRDVAEYFDTIKNKPLP